MSRGIKKEIFPSPNSTHYISSSDVISVELAHVVWLFWWGKSAYQIISPRLHETRGANIFISYAPSTKSYYHILLHCIKFYTQLPLCSHSIKFPFLPSFSGWLPSFLQSLENQGRLCKNSLGTLPLCESESDVTYVMKMKSKRLGKMLQDDWARN